jgi:hypothetical protein
LQPPRPEAGEGFVQRWWRRALQPKALIVETLTLASSMLGLVVFWHQGVPSFYPPSNVSGQDPLLTPFVVKNETWLFPFERATTECSMDKLTWAGPYRPDGIYISDFKTAHPQEGRRLPVGKPATVDCALLLHVEHFSHLDLTATLISARAQITVHYRYLLVPRTDTSPHYCWSQKVPQWVICDDL